MSCCNYHIRLVKSLRRGRVSLFVLLERFDRILTHFKTHNHYSHGHGSRTKRWSFSSVRVLDGPWMHGCVLVFQVCCIGVNNMAYSRQCASAWSPSTLPLWWEHHKGSCSSPGLVMSPQICVASAFPSLELSFNPYEFGRMLLVKSSRFGKLEVHVLGVV